MLNPITTNRVYFIAYVLIWMFIAVLQMGIEHFVFGMEILCHCRCLTVQFIHMLTGLAVWYPVRFNPVSPGICSHR